jgi:TPR repeat protein
MTGVIGVVLLSVGSAMAGALDDCEAAYDRQDYVLALRLCRPLAEQGDPIAQTALGNLYYEGWGVEQDYTSGANCSGRRPSRETQPVSLALAGLTSRATACCRTNMWYNLAAAQGAGVAAKNRDRMAAKMTPEQIAEAQRLARRWKPTK